MGLRDRSGVPGEARLGRRVRARGGRAARPRVPGQGVPPPDDVVRRIIDPLQAAGPRPGPVGDPPRPRARRPGLRPAQARAAQRDPRPVAAGRRSSSAARRPTPATPRSSPTTAPTQQKERYLQPLLDGRDLLLLLDDRAAGRLPTRRCSRTRAVTRRRRVGDQRLEVLLVERPHRVVPHRDGGHQPRRERLPGHVDVPGADRHARRRDRAQRRPGGRAARTRACTPSSTTTTCGCRPTPCSAARARPSPSPRPASAAAASTTPCAPSACARRRLDMMCERALSRETQGELLADKQFVQGYIADSYAQLMQFRLFVLLHGVEDRQVQRLPQGAQGHRRGQGGSCRRCCTTSRWRAMQVHGALGASNEMPFVQHDARRRRDGPRRRPDRGPQGHRRPRGAQGLQARADDWPTEHLPSSARPRPPPSGPTCSSASSRTSRPRPSAARPPGRVSRSSGCRPRAHWRARGRCRGRP